MFCIPEVAFSPFIAILAAYNGETPLNVLKGFYREAFKMNNEHRVRIHDLTAIFGLLAATPAILFVSFNIMKYQLGWLPDIDIIAVHPAILIGGSIFAVLANTWSVQALRIVQEDKMSWLMFAFRNRGLNLAVILIAAGFLLVMFAYIIVENLSDVPMV